MDKNNQMIMVVNKKILFGDDYFQGIQNADKVNYEPRILNNFSYMRRGDVETDPSLKQPIAYAFILNPILKKAFAYKRASEDKKYTDRRLQGKWSWGVGGHIEQIDTKKGENPIHKSMNRELYEEVQGLEKNPKIKILGYINDDNQYDLDTKKGIISIGRVHFGILYLVETNSNNISPLDKESEIGELMSKGQLEEILESPDCTVETWSRIAFDLLKKFL